MFWRLSIGSLVGVSRFVCEDVVSVVCGLVRDFVFGKWSEAENSSRDQ